MFSYSINASGIIVLLKPLPKYRKLEKYKKKKEKDTYNCWWLFDIGKNGYLLANNEYISVKTLNEVVLHVHIMNP